MNTYDTHLRVATLKAVLNCEAMEIPEWPSGCTNELLEQLKNDGYLEWKIGSHNFHGGWDPYVRNTTEYCEYHVTASGKLFIDKNSQK